MISNKYVIKRYRNIFITKEVANLSTDYEVSYYQF